MMSITPMTFAELTKEDLREIEAIVQKSEERLEKQLREYIDLKFAAQEATINGRFAKIDERFEGIDKQLQMLMAFVIALIGLIAVTIGIPQIIIAFRERKAADWQKAINALKQEVETLKQSRVLRS
jgi:hypothetical protein